MKAVALAAALLLSLPAISSGQGAPPAPPAPPPGRLGGPLPALSATQRAAFADGFNAFRQRENAESGLGPIFNDFSCIACHGAPAPGGGSRRTVTLFGRASTEGFDPLVHLGGPLLQDRALRPDLRERIPAEANLTARRLSTPLFGAGLIEAIPDAALRAAAAMPNKPDGVRGRAALVRDLATGEERVGRFGWKARHATLLAFNAEAYVNELGVTNRFFRADQAPNGDLARLDRADRVLDPEDEADPRTGLADLDRVSAYLRLLAPPPRSASATTASARAGEGVFASLGCVACHTPELRTGPSSIPALSNQRVPLYSDLLLHDMGSLGDGFPEGAAGPREMRTAPLWGLGLRDAYLHDGRATTLDAAIRAHDGEAAPARARYERLAAPAREQLLAFLRSL
jgi:CxxC motif-containing protein (DUF1111 family)